MRAGVEFLVGTQHADGGWDEEPFTGTGFPRVFYLKYHMYPVYFPLMALGRYAAVSGGKMAVDRNPGYRLDVGHAVVGPNGVASNLLLTADT